MMKIFGFFIGFVFLVRLPVAAQRVIEVRYEQDAQGNYQFYATNHAFCDYILQINFSSFDNLKSDLALPYREEIKPGNTKLFKLTPIRAGDPVKFKYGIGFVKGCQRPQPNPDFTYLLPIGPGKETQAYEMEGPGKSAGDQQEIISWYAVRLKMKPGDTIYAARRGIVNEVDVSSNLNDSGVASIGSENYIEIIQADCSFARYGILKKNSALVKAGQVVEAGMPIGLVGGDRFGRGSEVRFRVYYHQIPQDPGNSGDTKTYWVYLPIQFWIKYKGKGKLVHGADYVCEHPASVMNQEKPKPAMGKKTPPRKK